MKPIYRPKGAAKEYCDYAINIYTGCTHGCDYCYAKDMHERFRPNEQFNENVRPREGLLKALEIQLKTGEYRNKLIHLCFTCDPYPNGVDNSITREVIRMLKVNGSNVQILSKSPIERDLDMLTPLDWFGITITGFHSTTEIKEPNAFTVNQRQQALKMAHNKGVKTWVSFEPVFDVEFIYQWLEWSTGVDMYRIGKLNHRKSDINWKEFGEKCVKLCEEYGRNYQIKEDLLKEMDIS